MALISYDLLTRYLADDCTPVQRLWVDRWLDESPDREELVAALREVARDTRDLPVERKAAMLAAIRRRAGVASAEPPAAVPGEGRPLKKPSDWSLTLPRWSTWGAAVRVAAVLVVAATAVAGYAAFSSRATLLPASSTAGLRSFATTPGQRLVFRLPDGTAVTLGPASVLRLSADYGTRKRVVDLEGEAVFAVVHDAARSFEVRTVRGAVRDLGTRFLVRAYPDDPMAEVVVAEGLVAVLADTGAAAGGDSVVLVPRERARVTPDGGVMVSRGVPLDPYFAWTAGRLVFRDTPLREAAARMSRWYDLDVRIASPDIGDRLLTATFDEEDAADVFPLVAASLKLDLTRSGRIYTFAK